MPTGSRASTFRHVFGQSAARNEWFDWGAGHASCMDANPKFLAVALEGGAGGQVLVGRLTDVGKHGNLCLSRLHDHKDTVLDMKWNPFNDNVLATASADGTVRVWHVMDDLQVSCVRTLSRHSRRVEHLEWHSTVDNVLLTAASDGSIFLWDIEGDRLIVQISDVVASSISFNPNSSMFVVASKSNRRLTVFDSRTGTVRYSTVCPHDGNMSPRVCFVSSHRFVSLGNSRIGRRQLAVFSVRSPGETIGNIDRPADVIVDVDGASGQLIPLMDTDLGILYVTGKGDSTIRSYELLPSAPWVVYLSESQQPSSHSTVCSIAKRALHLADAEVMRVFRLHHQSLLIQPLSFIVPRRDGCFHSDLYPPTRGPTAACSLDEWLAGLDAQPVPLHLRPGLPPCTSKPVSLKGATGSPKLVTTDLNNDRKFRFLSQATRADYRVVDERDDCQQIRLMEQVKARLQSSKDSKENSISSSSEEKERRSSRCSVQTDMTTATEIPTDTEETDAVPCSQLVSRTNSIHSGSSTEAEDEVEGDRLDIGLGGICEHEDEDATTLGNHDREKEASSGALPNIEMNPVLTDASRPASLSSLRNHFPLDGLPLLPPKSSSAPPIAVIDELSDVDDVISPAGQAHHVESSPTSAQSVPSPLPPTTTTSTAACCADDSADTKAADDFRDPAEPPLSPPPSLTELAADLLSHVIAPPFRAERLRLSSSPPHPDADDVIMTSSEYEREASLSPHTVPLSPPLLSSARRTQPGVVSPRHKAATQDSARSTSSASSGLRRPVDEPIDVETNPFIQYFQERSPKPSTVTTGRVMTSSALDGAGCGEEKDDENAEDERDEMTRGENGNGRDSSTTGSDQTARSCSDDAQRILENTVAMLEQQLRRADHRAARLERLCDMQQRDMDSLRFEIEWKDERIGYLQKTLAEMEAGGTPSQPNPESPDS